MFERAQNRRHVPARQNPARSRSDPQARNVAPGNMQTGKPAYCSTALQSLRLLCWIVQQPGAFARHCASDGPPYSARTSRTCGHPHAGPSTAGESARCVSRRRARSRASPILTKLRSRSGIARLPLPNRRPRIPFCRADYENTAACSSGCCKHANAFSFKLPASPRTVGRPHHASAGLEGAACSTQAALERLPPSRGTDIRRARGSTFAFKRASTRTRYQSARCLRPGVDRGVRRGLTGCRASHAE